MLDERCNFLQRDGRGAELTARSAKANSLEQGRKRSKRLPAVGCCCRALESQSISQCPRAARLSLPVSLWCFAVNPPSSSLLRLLCVDFAFNAMLPCVQSLEPRWDSSNTQHGHLGGWIQVSTAPQPLLPQEEPWASFKSPVRVWKLGGSPCPAFQAAAVSPPSNPTCTALLPSCGTQSSLDRHWPPQSGAPFTPQPAPREEPPAPALGHSVTRFAFDTYSPFFSTVPSPLWRKSKPHFFCLFVCVFIRSPLFFQPPIFLLGPSP